MIVRRKVESYRPTGSRRSPRGCRPNRLRRCRGCHSKPTEFERGVTSVIRFLPVNYR